MRQDRGGKEKRERESKERGRKRRGRNGEVRTVDQGGVGPAADFVC